MSGGPLVLAAAAANEALRSLGLATATWPPGPTFVSGDASAPRAVLRLGESEPGEGYHREHVRILHGGGEPAALRELTIAVVASRPERERMESSFPAGSAPSWAAACEAADLVREAALPAAWRERGSGDAVELELWGRAGRRLREAPRAAPRTPRGETRQGRESLQVVAHSPATREALAGFLDSLVPGRSYPPGAILSDAERVETRRSGDLDADWVLALDGGGLVAGGVVLQVDGRPERRHVRRVHVDVLPAYRGRGLAARLIAAARERAGELGVERVEADPRAGHLAVVTALEKAGLRACGRQRGAWRMRTATASWDEDVVLLSASTSGRSGSA